MKLLIGGSPCTHWSIAQTKNRETKPEGLGWELFENYVIARNKFKPDYFLYENNKSMSAAIREQITKELGVEPVLINSALVSAQNRQRLYWVGKRNPDGSYSTVPVEQPEDRGIFLRDILETGMAWREKGYTLKASNGAHSGPSSVLKTIKEPGKFLANGAAEPVRIGTIESNTHTTHDSKPFRVYSPDGKAVTQQGEAGGYGAKTGLYACPVAGRVVGRRVNEAGHRDDYNEALPHVQRFEVNDDPQKTNCLTTVQKDNMVAVPACLRYVRSDTAKKLRKAYEAGEIKHGYHEYHELHPREAGKTNTLSTVEKDNMIIDSIRVGDMPNADGVIKGGQAHRIYDADGKGVTLTARPNGGGVDGPLYAVPAGMACRGRNNNSSYEMRGDQKSNAVIVGHQSRLVIEVADGKTYPVYEVKDGQITINGKQYPIKLRDGYYIIRKLTVTECKRLQTVPDDYIFPVSDTQAYKMLGNGWTVDVIAHILSHIPGIPTDPLTVLSMYDGMSCGHIALDKLGAEVARYYATEIDKWAIKTTQANYPDTVQLGDAFEVRDKDWRLEDA